MNNLSIPAHAGPMFARSVSAPLASWQGDAQPAGHISQAVERVYLGRPDFAWLRGNQRENFTKLLDSISDSPRVKPGYGVALATGAHSAGQGTASKGIAEQRPRRTAADVQAGVDTKVRADRRDADPVQRRLEMNMAAWAAAKKAVQDGKDWRAVAEQHDITNPGLRSRLERMAAWRDAKKEVRAGEDWTSVADRRGITKLRLRSTLQRIAAMSAAKKEIRAGEDWKSVAERHGITKLNLLFALQRIAAMSAAEKEIQAGGDWKNVAERHGITELHLLSALERTAAMSAAKKEIGDGKDGKVVAEPHGITHSSMRSTVERLSLRDDVMRERRSSPPERSGERRGEPQVGLPRSAKRRGAPRLRLRYGK